MGAWRLPFLSIFITGGGCSSLKNQNHCLFLRKNMMGSGVNDVSGRSGMFEIGCDYACGVCISVSADDSICQPKGSRSHCSGWMESTVCSFCNCCSYCCDGIGSVSVFSWNVSHVCDYSEWIVICPLKVWVYHNLESDLSLCCSWGRNLVGEVLCKVAKFITGVTLHWASGCQNGLSVHKVSIIIRNHADPGGCQHGCYLLCCIEFLNYSNDFRQGLWVLFVNLSWGGVCIPNSLNKNADGCSVTIKAHHLAAVLK